MINHGNNRAVTARLLKENDLMDIVKSFAENYTRNGKLPSVAVKAKTESAYFRS